MPAGRWGLRHYQAVHRHIFQDVYPWAGRPRTIRISRGASMFCYPEHLAGESRRVFGQLQASRFLRGLDETAFAAAAAPFLAELNAIHLFRDGNGRTQLAFMALLAEQAGHPLELDRLDPEPFLAAMIASFNGDERPLAGQLAQLVQENL